MGSILNDTKKMLAIPEESKEFDQDIIIFINATLSRLEQLGVGPVGGYAITGDEEDWSEFEDRPTFSDIKAYVFLSVRIYFDPPTVGTVMNAFKEQIEKLEWTINVKREEDKWVTRQTSRQYP